MCTYECITIESLISHPAKKIANAAKDKESLYAQIPVCFQFLVYVEIKL